MTHLETLINRWIAGDQRAAEEIYNLHQARVYRLSFGLLGDERDAEEAAQDALAYALQHIRNFDPHRSKFTTWLYMITVSRCRDLLRKRRIPALSFSDWLQKVRSWRAPDLTPEQEAIQKERNVTIWDSVERLSPILREAIILRHWGGHTYQEIADIVGCPIRTAQSRVRLAYRQLTESLNELEGTAFAEDKL